MKNDSPKSSFPRRNQLEGNGETRQSAATASIPNPFEIPFIGDRKSDVPFSDLDGGGSVDNPADMLKGWRSSSEFEAAVGKWNTVQAALVQVLADTKRAVARIAVPAGNFTDYLGRPAVSGWYGTGFLVGKNLLLTNHHVLNSVDVASAAMVEFNYEISREDLLAGRADAAPAAKSFKLDPQRLFVTSEARGNGLDYSFVWIEEAAGEEFGIIPMKRASFTVKKFDPVFIVHHPQGRLKEVSVDDTEVVRIQSSHIHYAADTDYGSSGSPVIDRMGRLIALHHARNTEGRETLQDGVQTDVLNEGVKISAIGMDLETRIENGLGDSGMQQAVLNAMSGSDSLAGIFGSLGRDVRTENAVERVVDSYKGTDQDLDCAFWNIEWLSNRWRDQAKLAGAARVIADLQVDIWCLEEISPPAVKALVAELLKTFGENYAYAFSEPNAPESKQSTAVIWKPRTVTGSRVEWPRPIRDWWLLDSRDDLPFEAVDGKIFDRYPGLFRFARNTSGRQTPFDFYLVPLHLKAKAEGSKRRKLASMLLARAIQQMIRDGEDADWIVGGDVNADLASRDLAALSDSGLVAMSAADEAAGAFTYLKSPRSLIDNIFLTEDITQTRGGADYFIVAKEKSVDQFVKQVSDHRPIVLRVAFDEGSHGHRAADDKDMQRIVDAITANGRRSPVKSSIKVAIAPKAKSARKKTAKAAAKPSAKAAKSRKHKAPNGTANGRGGSSRTAHR